MLPRTWNWAATLIKAFPLVGMHAVQQSVDLALQELDSEDPEHAAWWEALLNICRDELQGVTRQDEADRAKLKGARPAEARRQREVGVHSAVDAETQELLAGD